METVSEIAADEVAETAQPSLGWKEGDRVFRILMWVPVFFLPLPVPGLGTPPDFVGWLIALGGLMSVSGPDVRPMRRVVQLGLALSVARIALVVGGTSSTLHLGLYFIGSAAAAVLVVLAGGLAAEMARAADNAAFAGTAESHRWLFVIHPAVPALAAVVFRLTQGGLAGLLLAYVPLFLDACLIYAVMRIMERASRLCRKQQMTGETGQAD
ncbi:MAG: hypothetical protein R6X33_09530 [Candidatus Brocadiia bacterium]